MSELGKRKAAFAVAMLGILLGMLCSCGLPFSSGRIAPRVETRQYQLRLAPELSRCVATDFIAPDGTMREPSEAKRPEKEGFEFKYYSNDEEGLVRIVPGRPAETYLGADSFIRVYAVFDPITFHPLVVDGHNPDREHDVGYGEKLEISAPQATGYEFAGWHTDPERTIPIDLGRYAFREPKNAEDIAIPKTIYAKMTPRKYSVTYETFGGAVGADAPKEYDIETPVALPSDVERAGYAFKSWHADPGLLSAAATSIGLGETGDKKFYAKYVCGLAELRAKKGQSKVVEGAEPESVVYECCADCAGREDYDFRAQFEFSQNATFSARFAGPKPDAKTLLIKENGMLRISANTPAEGEGNTEKREFAFKLTVVSEDGKQSREYDVRLTQYGSNDAEATFVVDDETVKKVAVKKGESVKPEDWPEDPVRPEYDFEGWFDGDAKLDGDTLILEDREWTARFKPIPRRIEYRVGFGANDPSNPLVYDAESDTIVMPPAIPPEHEAVGYEFEGWFKDAESEEAVKCADFSPGENFASANGLAGDVTLHARYARPAKWEFEQNDDGQYVTDLDEYPSLLDYLIFKRIGESIAIVDVGEAKPSELDLKLFTEPKGEVNAAYDLKVNCNYTPDKGPVTADIKLKGFDEISGTGPTDAQKSATYAQIDFVRFCPKTPADPVERDLAVDHLTGGALMRVSTSDQLFFALENGFRPVPERPGCPADLAYAKLREILKAVVSDDMTDVEKTIAISEYLIESVAYDNYVFGLSEEAAKGYRRSFSLEGAIIDKIAVCDGISKAFSALCAMEGIKAIQTAGKTEIATGEGAVKSGHAWNKALVDVDGDGQKEWRVVDATSANLLLGGSGNEIAKHKYILCDDEFIFGEKFEYDERFSDKYATAGVDYDIYANTAYKPEGEGEDFDYLIDSEDELNDLLKFFASKVAVAESPLSIDFCAKKDLVLTKDAEPKIGLIVGNALEAAGLDASKMTFSFQDVMEKKQGAGGGASAEYVASGYVAFIAIANAGAVAPPAA